MWWLSRMGGSSLSRLLLQGVHHMQSQWNYRCDCHILLSRYQSQRIGWCFIFDLFRWIAIFFEFLEFPRGEPRAKIISSNFWDTKKNAAGRGGGKHKKAGRGKACYCCEKQLSFLAVAWRVLPLEEGNKLEAHRWPGLWRRARQRAPLWCACRLKGTRGQGDRRKSHARRQCRRRLYHLRVAFFVDHGLVTNLWQKQGIWRLGARGNPEMLSWGVFRAFLRMHSLMGWARGRTFLLSSVSSPINSFNLWHAYWTAVPLTLFGISTSISCVSKTR